MKVMYPGSFDPITFGHIDLIERCAAQFDHVVVAIMMNDQKSGTFTRDERLMLANDSLSHLGNVEIVIGNGLTVDFAEKLGCSVLIRGIRAVMDYETELQLATSNRALNPKIESLFLVAAPEYSYISSSAAREIAKYGGDLSKFVPQHIAGALYIKLQNTNDSVLVPQ